MNNMKNLFDILKKSFTIQKKIEIEDIGLTIILEPITTAEEINALEAIKDLNGNAFMDGLKKNTIAYSIKKINDIEFQDSIIDYEDDNGKKVSESKYIFLHRQIEQWPSALRDILFIAYNDLQAELEKKVTDRVKFEKFIVQEPAQEIKPETKNNIPEGFRKIEDKEEDTLDK